MSLTMKESEEWSDVEVLITILSERINKLNPYTPFSKRLRNIRGKLEHSEPLTKR